MCIHIFIIPLYLRPRRGIFSSYIYRFVDRFPPVQIRTRIQRERTQRLVIIQVFTVGVGKHAHTKRSTMIAIYRCIQIRMNLNIYIYIHIYVQVGIRYVHVLFFSIYETFIVNQMTAKTRVLCVYMSDTIDSSTNTRI